MIPEQREADGPTSGRLLYSIPDAAQKLGGITERKLWSMVADGEIKSVKLGRRRMITAAALEAYVHGLEAAA
jgi:excisionase family DNA binding protein